MPPGAALFSENGFMEAAESLENCDGNEEPKAAGVS